MCFRLGIDSDGERIVNLSERTKVRLATSPILRELREREPPQLLDSRRVVVASW